MEGIFDGRAVDSCFYCLLLYPGQEDCPRCHSRMRYAAAAMMSDADLADALNQSIERYRSPVDSRPARVTALLDLLDLIHRYAPTSLALLGDLGGPALAELRRAYEALASSSAQARA